MSHLPNGQKQTLYLECKTGISGDMTVAALLDLGADKDGLLRALEGLRIGGYEARVTQTVRNGIAGCDFDVVLADETAGQSHAHDHEHEHEHGHGHHHEHGHGHHHAHSHGEQHRNLRDIMRILDGSDLSDRARLIARRTFEIIAEAEAKAHGIPAEEVHFHEVGAIDSIVDIVSAAYCLDSLGAGAVVVPRLAEGSGAISCRHGILPVPVPAVVNIAASHGVSLRITDVETELVTPTGIAIVAAIRTSERLPGSFKINRIGIGLGKREIGRPNFLRAMLITPDEGPYERGEQDKPDKQDKKSRYTMLESNIDDGTGEELALAMERLMAAGALDVHYVPCVMKKNRPGWLLRVVCLTEDVPALEDIVFRTTTTIGIRRAAFERTALEREQISVRLPYGAAEAKRCRWRGDVFCYPEYESVKKLSDETGRPFSEVYAHVKCEAAKKTDM